MIKRQQARVTEAEVGGEKTVVVVVEEEVVEEEEKEEEEEEEDLRTFSKVRSMPPGELPQDIQLHTVNVHVCGISFLILLLYLQH